MQASTSTTQTAKIRNKISSIAPTSSSLPQIVSLFCGAGGLDWGFHQHGYKIALAIDISVAAIQTHKRNFPTTPSFADDLITLGPDGVYELVKSNIPSGDRIAVIGGPPCQGFSRANTASYTNDPRNKLPTLYVDIVKKLQTNYEVEFVVFENVLGMRDKKHNTTYQKLVDDLANLGFDITEKELCSLDFGVPQTRRRIVLSALKKDKYTAVTPQPTSGPRTVRSVLSNLPEPAFFSRKINPSEIPHHPNHWTMNPKSARFSNTDITYPTTRSFRRLDWDKPSPTVAYGNREIHIHPNGHRRLSVYEAMLLQGFPLDFVLEGNFSQQIAQVSNAVPPPLSSSIALAVKTAMECK